MLLLIVLVAMLSIASFFHEEIKRTYQKINKIPYLFSITMILLLTHLTFSNIDVVDGFLSVMQYHLNHFLKWVFNFVYPYMAPEYAIFITKFLLKVICLGIWVIYPYYYQRNLNCLVHASEILTVKVICAFILLIELYIFSVFGL
ncbi:MAG: hypothetical protein EBQ95_08380 [Gammaproteobacteria bacterium]|nr:hypothetical protein [Gammaproteobacteria bacterium]